MVKIGLTVADYFHDNQSTKNQSDVNLPSEITQ